MSEEVFKKADELLLKAVKEYSRETGDLFLEALIKIILEKEKEMRE